jgi:hypothetical protein
MEFHTALYFPTPSLMAFIVGRLSGRWFAHKHPDDAERIETAWKQKPRDWPSNAQRRSRDKKEGALDATLTAFHNPKSQYPPA